MTIQKWQKEVHQLAIEKGWWDKERAIGDIFANFHAEISEAWEEHRKGLKPTDSYICEGKPEGMAIELADCIIRILDFCGKYNIDIEGAIEAKHNFIKTRPYRHGNKVA